MSRTAELWSTVRRLGGATPARVAVVVWWCVVLAVRLSGQGFSTDYLGYGWQLVPIEVLRADPLGSVWHLHIQPPLFNLLVGLVTWGSPVSDAVSFQVLQLVVGAVLVASIVRILQLIGFGSWWAGGVALVATLNTEVLCNVFIPNYELLVSCLLTLAVLVIVRVEAGGRSVDRGLILLSIVATTVALTRTVYHPVWLVAVVGLAAWHWRGRVELRSVVIAALIPVVLVGGWMVKNEVMFGRATLSSWLGMNLQRAVIPLLPEDERVAMHDAGQLSSVAMVGPFGLYDLYRPVVPACSPHHDHPSLTIEVRQYEVPVPNLNYECYLPLYDQAQRDALEVIREHPAVFLEGRKWAARTWFATNRAGDVTPSVVLRQLGNLYQVLRLDVTGNLSTMGWGQPIYGELDVPARFSLATLQLTLLMAVAGVVKFVAVVRRRAGRHGLMVAVSGFIVLWTYVVGVVGELGEQARFRTMTDPLVWAIGIALTLRWLASRWTRLASWGVPNGASVVDVSSVQQES